MPPSSTRRTRVSPGRLSHPRQSPDIEMHRDHCGRDVRYNPVMAFKDGAPHQERTPTRRLRCVAGIPRMCERPVEPYCCSASSAGTELRSVEPPADPLPICAQPHQQPALPRQRRERESKVRKRAGRDDNRAALPAGRSHHHVRLGSWPNLVSERQSSCWTRASRPSRRTQAMHCHG